MPLLNDVYILPVRQITQGYHDCGAEYGYSGEHAHYRATYECPECGIRMTLDQCNAWPITVTNCDGCTARLSCELDQTRAKGVQR